MRHFYIVADLCISSDIDLVGVGIKGFKPFEVESANGEADCHITFDKEINRIEPPTTNLLSTSWIAEANANGSFYATDDGYLYRVEQCEHKDSKATFHINTETKVITTDLMVDSVLGMSLLRFGIWVMFGVVLASHQGIAIHSSAIVHKDRVVLFLGESGTGKSTHTRLWRENIIGANLLNDDSPIIRIKDGAIRVYGSPWSGKTPCYRNLSYPIAGLCRLSQAPYNKIRKLSTIASIGALLPSCPPVFAKDEKLQDSICSTIGYVIRHTGVYHLECLPNSDAAFLSESTIYAE